MLGRLRLGGWDSWLRALVDPRPRSTTPSPSLPLSLDDSRIARAIPHQRPTSVPLISSSSDGASPRSASLGRIVEAGLPSSPSSAAPSLEHSSDSDESHHIKTMRKEKTRSRVWSIFGGGRKKDKKDKVEASPEPKLRHAFEVRPVDGESPFLSISRQ